MRLSVRLKWLEKCLSAVLIIQSVAINMRLSDRLKWLEKCLSVALILWSVATEIRVISRYRLRGRMKGLSTLIIASLAW
jgi:hypothetical protein